MPMRPFPALLAAFLAPLLLAGCAAGATGGGESSSASAWKWPTVWGTEPAEGWQWPMDDAEERPKLLTFGLYVTPDPENNPIDPPERFTGYHTALDLEILPGEEDAEVAVYAACAGKILTAASAEGYGGVVVQSCTLDGQDVTVLYGHVEPRSLQVRPGDAVETGTRIALLAAGHSMGSDGNRKHLHFGIHRGTRIDYLGYLQTPDRLPEFVDPITVLER